MEEVLVGGLSPEAEALLEEYLNYFIPTAKIRPVKATGAKGDILRAGTNPNVLLIVLDEILWSRVYDSCKKVLDKDNAYKYTNQQSLKEYLISQFGKLPTDSDSSSSDSLLSDSFPVDEEDDMIISASTEDESKVAELEEKVEDLQKKLASSEMLIKNLQAQLADDGDSDEVNELIQTIADLRNELAQKDEQLKTASSSSTNEYELLGKVAKAEMVIKEVDTLKANLNKANENYANLEHEKSVIEKTKAEIEAKVSSLESDVAKLQQDIKDKTEEANRLQAEVDEKDQLLQNNEVDINGKQEEINLLQEKVKELDIVKEELANLKTQLHNKTVEYDNLKIDFDKLVADTNAQIATLNEQLQAKESENTTLSSQVTSLESSGANASTQVAELTSQITELQQKLTEAEGNLEKTETFLAEKLQDLKMSEAEVSDMEEEVNQKTTKIKEQEETITEKVTEIATKDAQITTLNEQLTEKDNQIAGYASQITDLTSQITARDNQIYDLTNQLQSDGSKVTELQHKIDTMQSTLTSQSGEMGSQITVLNEQITSLTQEKEGLATTVAEKDTEIQNLILEKEGLEGQITGLETLVNQKDEEIDGLTTEIDSLNSQIKTFKEKELLVSEEIKGKDSAVESVIAERDAKIEALAQVESERDVLNEKIKALEEQISASEQLIQEADNAREKAEKECETLRSSLETSNASAETINKLENELLEEKRTSARLKSEVDVLKKSDSSGKTAELRKEISRLNDELTIAKTQAVDSSEVTRLEEEVIDAKQRVAILEAQVVEKEELLEEYNSSLFGRMADIALPRVQYDLKMDIPENYLDQHYYCYAAGSDESSTVVYSTIRKSCMANKDASILIVDLTTDSTIDRDLGLQSVQSPINWLAGTDSFTKYVANTKFPNVKVISTALAFVNDLFFLSVDWSARIKELVGYADGIIIYVGCLNNLVARVLFNTFNQVMRTHLIVKATPINIRSTIFNVSGYPTLTNMTVDCVNFDNASQKFYQKLSEVVIKNNGNVNIVRDSDIIKL